MFLKSRPSTFRLVQTMLIAVFTLLSFAGFSCNRPAKAGETTESISDIQKRQGIPVRVVTANRTSLSVYQTVGGTAEGYFQTTISAGMPGTITKVNVSIGDYVREDSSLMRIEPNTPQNYTIAKQQYDNVAKSRERVTALAKEGAVSQELIDQIDAGYSSAKEGLNMVRKAQFVIAPISGTVVNIFNSVNSTVNPGTELIQIADIRKIKIPLTVSDMLINKFKKGQTAIALVDGDSVTGVIERIPLAGNESTHTFIIDAVFENSDRKIKPGMYINVVVIVDARNDIVTLPMDAIIIEGDRTSAYIVSEGTARKIPLSLGVRSTDTYEITDGIVENTTVIISGTSLLSEGAKIKIVD